MRSGHHISIPAIAAWIQKKGTQAACKSAIHFLSQDERTQLLSGEIDLFETILLETIDLDEALSWETVDSVSQAGGDAEKQTPSPGKRSLPLKTCRTKGLWSSPPWNRPTIFRYVRQICLDHGFEPHISTHVANAANLISSISADDEVVICDKYIRDHDNPMMKYFPLPDTWSGQVVIWKKDNPNRFLPEAVSGYQGIS